MLRTAILAAAALMLAAPAANALLYTTTLTGAAEVPSVDSPGSGSASVDFDLTTHTMKVEISFAGLLADTTVAHIHCCTSPTAGVATAVPTFPGFPAGVRSGSYSQSFDTLATSTYSPAFLTASGGTAAGAEAAFKVGLDSGFAYVNVHSAMFPAGEIRGNLAPIPEPSTVALMALGLGVIAVAARRRRR